MVGVGGQEIPVLADSLSYGSHQSSKSGLVVIVDVTDPVFQLCSLAIVWTSFGSTLHCLSTSSELVIVSDCPHQGSFSTFSVSS
jgi:hypothetical protein